MNLQKFFELFTSTRKKLLEESEKTEPEVIQNPVAVVQQESQQKSEKENNLVKQLLFLMKKA